MTTASHKQAASKHPAKHSESKQSRGGHAEGKHAEGKDLESKLAETDPIELKLARVQQQVQDLFATHPDWIKFYRDVIGCEGLIRRVFPNHEAMAEFEQTEIYHDIHRMLTELQAAVAEGSEREDEGHYRADSRQPARTLADRGV